VISVSTVVFRTGREYSEPLILSYGPVLLLLWGQLMDFNIVIKLISIQDFLFHRDNFFCWVGACYKAVESEDDYSSPTNAGV
jgi:hypothetical protein